MGHEFSKKNAKYIVNGREYDSLDELPEPLRKLLEDRDGDGRPDLFEGKLAELQGAFGKGACKSIEMRSVSSIEMRTVNGVTTYRVGDREYGSLEEMPPEHRALFERREAIGLLGPRPGGVRGRETEKAERVLCPSAPAAGPTASPAREDRYRSPTGEESLLMPGRGRDPELAHRRTSDGLFLLLLFLVLILAAALFALVVMWVL